MAAPRDPEPKNVGDRLVTLGSVLTKEEDVMDRAFALGVGTRELFDTIRDPAKTAELYTTLGSTNIKVSAWKPLSQKVTLPLTAMPLAQDKDEHIRLGHEPFTVFQRLVQRYRADGAGVPYLVSSVEYLCLYDEDNPVPRLFVLFRISQTPTQQFGDIMQLHEYLTFYRRGRAILDSDDEAVRERLVRVNTASMRRTMVNYRPSIEYAGSKPVLHHLIKRIAIPSMRKAFSDWVAALGPLAARFAEEMLAKAREVRAKEKADAAARIERLEEAHADVADGDSDQEGGEAGPGSSAPGGTDAGSSGQTAASGAKAASAAGAAAPGSASGAGGASVGGGSEGDGAESAADEREGIRNVFMGSLSAAKKRAALLKRRSGEKAKSGQDVRRLEDRAAAMREQREEETRKLRRLVHAHVNGEAVTLHDAEAARLEAAREKLHGSEGGEGPSTAQDPAARAQKLREDAKRAAMEAMAAAERESDFGFLDSYSLAGDDVGGGGAGRLVLDNVDESDLTGRFWAQTFTRDCSIWPGEMEGDDPSPVVDLFALAFGTRADGSVAGRTDADYGDRLDAIAPRYGPGGADEDGEDQDPGDGADAGEDEAAGPGPRGGETAETEREADATEEAYEEKKRRLLLEDPAARQAHLLSLLVGDGAASAIRDAPGADALPPKRGSGGRAGPAAGSMAQGAPSWAAESKRGDDEDDDDDRRGSGRGGGVGAATWRGAGDEAKPGRPAAPATRQSVLMTVAGVDATPASLADLLGTAPAAEPVQGERASSAASEGGFESDGAVDDFRPIGGGSVDGLSIPKDRGARRLPAHDELGARARPGRGECTPADMPCAVM